MITPDPYFERPEVSNSDLSQIKLKLSTAEYVTEFSAAFRFGNLVDAMITLPDSCDHYRCRVGDSYAFEQFTREEWVLAYAMLKACRNDQHCQYYLKHATGQKVFTVPEFKMEFEDVQFELPMRCKYDLWLDKLGYGGDIKSTVATTRDQFLSAIKYFDYDRSRALYMDLSGADRDLIIGISKVPPHRIFKVPIVRGDAMYTAGKRKYLDLAFQYYILFADAKIS